MTEPHHGSRTMMVVAIMAIFVTALAVPVSAADPPVTFTFAVSGNPTPGATVTAKVTVKINDGSTLQSLTWTQTGGTPVTLSSTTTDTVTVVLPDRNTFKEHLIEVLEEAPIAAAQYPAYVPRPEKFEGGLQNRFGVVAISPHALTDMRPKLNVKAVTSSGTYNGSATIAAKLPWPTAIGVRNVPLGLPVLLHGKTQATYDWALSAPAGSSATLSGATGQSPELTPDTAGEYAIAVTDLAMNKSVKLTLYAGTWQGIVTGQDSDGRPVADSACMACHVKNTPRFDLFTPWAKTGHAEIFTQNVNNPAGHYAANCLSCHTVGYSMDAKNDGIDDVTSFAAFAESGLLTHGDPNNWTEILAKYPEVAKKANIQCENCHGPQTSAAHMKKDGSRKTLSSDLCGSCHGEPARHGRYQQWQISKHANYETAVAEGTNATCAKCHSAQGYVAWANNKFSTAALSVTWTAEEVHPVTCATCHDPHDIGTTSGRTGSSSMVRVVDTTPLLPAGFTAKNVGKGAICMTCHNGRRGLKDDAHFSLASAAQAPHQGPQADILMGQNLYFTQVGKPGLHATVANSCVDCHMTKTDPPAALSYQKGGTNHSFFASPDICTNCHARVTAAAVQGEVEEKMEALKEEIEDAIQSVMQLQIRLGNAIDVGGLKTIRDVMDVAAIELAESHGQQGIIVTLGNGTKLDIVALGNVKVVPPAGAASALYSVTDPNVAKASWNFFMVEADKSKGVHNPAFVNSALDVSLFAVKTFNATAGGTTPTTPGLNYIGGGIGNGAGAVSCTTAYVYWAEIAGHAPGGMGSQWRTDVVARNLSSSNAAVKFILHQAAGNLETTGTIGAASQKAFEDIVATLGGTNNIGSLEICSDKPLLVRGQIFNDAGVEGTYGQGLDGHVADLGYTVGQTVSLIGLRQKLDAFRTNISVTNAGKTDGEVAVKLYDDDGTLLQTFNIAVPAGLVVQESEPFKNKANAPDIGWGYATVTVIKGTNIKTMASLVDNRTNDPTTIEPKQ